MNADGSNGVAASKDFTRGPLLTSAAHGDKEGGPLLRMKGEIMRRIGKLALEVDGFLFRFVGEKSILLRLGDSYSFVSTHSGRSRNYLVPGLDKEFGGLKIQ